MEYSQNRIRPRSEPPALLPYVAAEWMLIPEASRVAGTLDRPVPVRTMRRWCEDHGIGRKIAGDWRVNRAGLEMLLQHDEAALRSFVAGDRCSPRVLAYYSMLGLDDVPKQLSRRLSQQGQMGHRDL